MIKQALPRGLRNNNPGNIVKSRTRWQGEVAGGDPRFCTFSSMAYGYRALMKLLQNYQRVHHLYTIRQLITRWAPSSENNTNAYIVAVARQTGYTADERIDMLDRQTAMSMAAAISKVENGRPAEMDDVARGWYLLKS